MYVCSTDEGESECVIVNESSTGESESESIQKITNTNKVKYAIYETEHGKLSVTDNTFIKETRYFNLFKCGKNILNRLDATCEQYCMEISRDRYYTEMYKTLTDYNYRNNTPLSNDNIR